jgi:hypothetical protein
MLNRVMRIERVIPLPDKQRAALVLVGGVGCDPERLIGASGVNIPRQPGEPLQAFLDRLESHVRETRPRALPLVALAQYSDDEPDA